MSKNTDNGGRPFSGLMPAMTIALVVDNVDEEKLGRIKVKFPTLPEMPESYWIRVGAQMGGKDMGMFTLPEVDDEVYVAFMHGSQDWGIVVGQAHNGVDVPPCEHVDGMPGSGKTDTGASWSTDKFTDGSTTHDDNDRRIWKSRSGHLFVFDDTSGAETVQIWDNSHTLALVFDTAESRIVLSNSSGDIHIRTATDLYLEAGNDIKYRAGNDINGECDNNMDINVKKAYTFEAGTTADEKSKTSWKTTVSAGSYDVDAKTTATIKCLTFEASANASATVKASATTTIKGGVVMIN